jgi:hypothetical protein
MRQFSIVLILAKRPTIWKQRVLSALFMSDMICFEALGIRITNSALLYGQRPETMNAAAKICEVLFWLFKVV